jgi:DNA-binding NarL/FixJ family response regulator
VKTKPGKPKSSVRRQKRRKASKSDTDTVLDIVREGVRRFILKDAPIGAFQKAIHAAARKGEQSSHPLTGIVFRRIVKEAVRERKRRIARN